MKKNFAALGELLFKQVDTIGFKLDAMGIENQINRHMVIATIFAGQKRFEGELDSLKARAEGKKANVEATLNLAEQLFKSGFDLVTFPATYTFARLKQLA